MTDVLLAAGPVLAILGATVAFLAEEEEKANTRIWMKPWLRRRDDPNNPCPTMYTLYMELLDDGEAHHIMRTLRMPPEVFENLLELLRPKITKKDTSYRKAICPEIRLCITLRFLCLGDGFWSIHQQFRVGHSTVAAIVYETCRKIYEVLQPLHLQVPKTQPGWKAVASAFDQRWNLPHVIGAVDGKHVRIRKPLKTESVFHNYKNYFSIVLMAVVDADYRFLYVDVGAEGSASDGGVWANSSFKKHFASSLNPLNIPKSSPVEGFPNDLNYYLVGDDAFPLSTSLMKPYPGQGLSVQQRLFNYRLSRCRRIVENAFGILAAKFAIYRMDLRMKVSRVVDIVKATCALHNYMRETCGRQYMTVESVDHDDDLHQNRLGSWRQVANVDRLQALPPRNSYQGARVMRDQIAHYCIREGSVEWQYNLLDFV